MIVMSGATDLKAPVMLLTGHTGELFALSFSPNGKHLASSGLDREICKTPIYIVLFNVFGDCENIAVLKGHKNAVIEVHWSHDNDFIFSCSADETLGLWDVEYRKRIKKFGKHPTNYSWTLWNCEWVLWMWRKMHSFRQR